MNINAMISDFIILGATGAAPIKIEELKIYPELRAICERNSCGNYGKNWVCPPACGPLEDFAEKLKNYKNVIFIQRKQPIEDSFDVEGMYDAMKEFSAVMDDIIACAREKYGLRDFIALGSGGCGLCEKCTYPAAPCVYPDRAIPSLEGFGLDVTQLGIAAGLPLKWSEPTVYSCGVIIF